MGRILCRICCGTRDETERDWLRVFGAGSCIYSLLTLVQSPRDGGEDGSKDVQMAPLVEVERETVVVAFDFDKCLMTRHWYVTMHRHLAHELSTIFFLPQSWTALSKALCT